jgi:hypothetical protein
MRGPVGWHHSMADRALGEGETVLYFLDGGTRRKKRGCKRCPLLLQSSYVMRKASFSRSWKFAQVENVQGSYKVMRKYIPSPKHKLKSQLDHSHTVGNG